MSEPFRINRVVLQNYRSIAYCDVGLRNLTFLSGPNGSGKSNFMDALRFVADSLRTSLEHAMRERGGIGEVRRRSAGRPNNFSIQLDFTLGEFQTGNYGFRIGAAVAGGFSVQYEECRILDSRTGLSDYFRTTENGPLESSEPLPAPSAPDRLHLVYASSLAAFRPVFDVLSGMSFYSPEPKSMMSPKPVSLEEEDALSANAVNVANVLDYLTQRHPRVRNRIEAYLKGILPNLASISVEGDIHYRYLRFNFQFPELLSPFSFGAENMSDGTLRALGVLVALFQRPEKSPGHKMAVVGIEEPETGLHPAAARLLFEALGEAAETRQVIVSTHSPDLLDSNDIDTDSILAVQIGEDGATQIGPVDDAGRSVLLKQFYTPGELMRLNQLQPQRRVADELSSSDSGQTEFSPNSQ